MSEPIRPPDLGPAGSGAVDAPPEPPTIGPGGSGTIASRPDLARRPQPTAGSVDQPRGTERRRASDAGTAGAIPQPLGTERPVGEPPTTEPPTTEPPTTEPPTTEPPRADRPTAERRREQRDAAHWAENERRIDPFSYPSPDLPVP
jgi:hypothetical protein